MQSGLILPLDPGPEPIGAVDLREWRKLQQTFWVEQKKFYGSFDTAIGILQSMLVYPSKARNDINIALPQRPADIPQEQWTPNWQF
jgi:hypothetical protein